MRGRWISLAAMFLAASACSAQCGVASNPNPTPVAATPTPSPSAVPTATLQASSPPFHLGEAGLAYAPVALSANGGRAPYKWSVASGALPGGLALGNDGSVSGTPTTVGTFSFTIQVNDSGDSTATIPGTISIADQVTASLISSCAQYCRVELGCDSTCGPFGVVSGGIGPYSYAVTQGPLPAGTSLSGLSLAGTFKGLSGYLKFAVQVTDSLGATATIAPTFWMYDHIAWSGTYLCKGGFGTACQVTITYTGGVPGGDPQVTLASIGPYCPSGATCPPPASTPGGMSTSASAVGSGGGGTVTVIVDADCGGGAGGCPNGYTGAIGLVLIDPALCGANAHCQSGVATVDVYMLPS